jgi:hypothetical protein
MELMHGTLAAALTLAAPDEVGALGIHRLKRYWSRTMLAQQGRPARVSMRERHLDFLVIHATGIGLEQTADYLGGNAPVFEDFERWIVQTTGGVAPERVARINAAVSGGEPPAQTRRWLARIEGSAPVLSKDDLAFWHENGYVVLHDAVPAESRDAAALAIWEHVGADPANPETWYQRRKNGIMVQYFQHPAF